VPGIVTGSERDEVIAQAESKAAALTAAKERLEAAKLDLKVAEKAIERLAVSEARLDVLRRGIDLAQANLTLAQADLAATVIRAPEDGWVARQLIEAGGSARVGDQIVALWTGDRLWIEAWVDESDLGHLKIGSPVDVYLAAYPDQVVPGRVDALGVLSDGEFLAAAQAKPLPPTNNSLLPTPTNVAARITVLNPNIRLMPGLTAVVGIHSGYRNPARQWLPTSVTASLASVWQTVSLLWGGSQDNRGNDYQTAGI
jgi:multidrug efflux pump subunit AcrA (membrane-fusion protein)